MDDLTKASIAALREGDTVTVECEYRGHAATTTGRAWKDRIGMLYVDTKVIRLLDGSPAPRITSLRITARENWKVGDRCTYNDSGPYMVTSVRRDGFVTFTTMITTTGTAFHGGGGGSMPGSWLLPVIDAEPPAPVFTVGQRVRVKEQIEGVIDHVIGHKFYLEGNSDWFAAAELEPVPEPRRGVCHECCHSMQGWNGVWGHDDGPRGHTAVEVRPDPEPGTPVWWQGRWWYKHNGHGWYTPVGYAVTVIGRQPAWSEMVGAVAAVPPKEA
jgi:hypothetical protein